MGWSQTRDSLRRRWYLAVAGLLGTAGLGFAAWTLVPPTYEARGTVLFLPPDYSLAEGQNPFLELANLDMPASVVAAYLDGDDARERISLIAPTADYTVELDPSVRGPIVLLTVEDTTPAGALRVLDTVLDSVPAALTDLQDQLDVPARATIASMRLAVDSEAEPVTRTTLRAVVAAAGFGVLVTVAGAVAFDTLLRRRASARRESGSVIPDLTSPGPHADRPLRNDDVDEGADPEVVSLQQPVPAP